MSDCEHKWNLMRVPYECPYCLRERLERAEENALGWERKNAQNVGKYEREADALRALLTDMRAADQMTRVFHWASRIDAALAGEKP